MPLSLKVACCPHVRWQSWESQHVPPDQWLTVPSWCWREVSPLCPLPWYPGLLSTAKQWSWPISASLTGGKKKKKRNGGREVRIYSFFHESHGRSKQARQRAAVLEPMDRGSCQLVLGVVTHVERAREPGWRHRYRERQ